MPRPRRQPRIVLAVLLLAGSICGCKKEDEAYEEAVVSAQLVETLEAGVSSSVQLWGEPSDHVYEGKAGEVVTIRVTTEAPGLDPNVRLLGPGGEEAFDDDSGGNGYALIQEHLLGSDGTYTIRIETDEDQPGEVSVVLSRQEGVEGTMERMEPLGTDLLTTTEPSGDGPVP